MEDPPISGFRQVTDMQDMETQASPSLLSVRQSDLKIIIDDFPDDPIKPSISLKTQENVQSIAKIVDEIRSLSRKQKVEGNINKYNTCHSCRTLLDRNYLLCCTLSDCKRYFCFRCLNKKFNKSLEEISEMRTIPDWSCVSCKGLCNCKICKDRFFKTQEFPQQLTRFEKNKRKQVDFPIKVETDNESEINAVKREFIEEESSLPIPGITSPGLSFPIPKQEAEQEEPMMFQIFPLTRPRSKLVAKSMLRQKRFNHIQESDSSSEEENSQSTKTLVSTPYIPYNENSNKSIQSLPKSTNNQKNTAKSKIKEECHFCMNKTPVSEMAYCSIESCNKYFCLSCIRANYQKDFDLSSYNPECWVCYPCGGTCECLKCKKKRNTTRRNPEVLKARDDLFSTHFQKKNSRLADKHEKRRMKFYDTLSDEEEEQELEQQRQFESQIEGAPEEYKTTQRDWKGGANTRKKLKTEESLLSFTNTIKDDIPNEQEISLGDPIKPVEEKEEKEVKDDGMEIEEIDEEEILKEDSVNKYILKKKRLRKIAAIDKEDIDESKIISEENMDFGITLYDAENEEELKKEAQLKFEG